MGVDARLVGYDALTFFGTEVAEFDEVVCSGPERFAGSSVSADEFGGFGGVEKSAVYEDGRAIAGGFQRYLEEPLFFPIDGWVGGVVDKLSAGRIALET